MPPTSLEDLPAELITTILYDLASPTALRSLIQASAQCFRIFLRSKSNILLTTLFEVLQPEIKSLVLLVHEAYHLPSFDGNVLDVRQRQGRQSLDAFVTKFSQDHEFHTPIPYLPSPHFVAPQLRTISTMEYFTEDYSNWVSSHQYSSNPHSIKAGITMGLPPPPPLQAHQNLTRVERFRLQQAFLRFEIFCTAMRAAGGHDRAPGAKHRVHQTNTRFLNILQPWEREELVCVLDYLTLQLEDIFDELELDYVERMTERFLNGEVDDEIPSSKNPSKEPAESSMSYPSTSIAGGQHPTPPDRDTHGGQPQAQIGHSAKFFTAKTKQTLHALYVVHLLTLGLPFLRRLFQSPIKEQRRLVLDNLSIDGEMAKLVMQKWVNRDQTQLLRRHGEDDSTTACRRYRQSAVAGVVISTTAAGAARASIQRNHRPMDGHTSDNERILTFQGDRLGMPNYAFLWAHGFTSMNVCSGCDYLHRSLGYVFWDRGRAHEMGLVGQWHWSEKWLTRWKELLWRRKRADEKSAQERLADMGFVVAA